MDFIQKRKSLISFAPLSVLHPVPVTSLLPSSCSQNSHLYTPHPTPYSKTFSRFLFSVFRLSSSPLRYSTSPSPLSFLPFSLFFFFSISLLSTALHWLSSFHSLCYTFSPLSLSLSRTLPLISSTQYSENRRKMREAVSLEWQDIKKGIFGTGD